MAEWLPGDRPESALTPDNPKNNTHAPQPCQPTPSLPFGPGHALGSFV
jgi:hypothetical protein